MWDWSHWDFFTEPKSGKKRSLYTPYAEAVTNSSERVPTQHQPPEPTTDQSTNKSLQTNRSVSLLPTLPVNCVDSMSQIVLSVDKIHVSNILNIKKKHPCYQSTTRDNSRIAQACTSEGTNSASSIILQQTKKKATKNSNREYTKVYGEYLTSPEAMTRLAEKEKIKNTQHSKDGTKEKRQRNQSKKTQTAHNQKTEADTEKA